jgi:hypothetical protein
MVAPQPDGMRLTDPDEIRPGWLLRLPVQPASAAHERPAGEPPHENSSAANRPPEPRLPPSPRATPAPAATSGTPSATPRPAETSATADTGEHGSSIAPTLVLGLGTLLLTGLVGELTRRRRLQQRSRGPGHRIAMLAAARRRLSNRHVRRPTPSWTRFQGRSPVAGDLIPRRGPSVAGCRGHPGDADGDRAALDGRRS